MPAIFSDVDGALHSPQLGVKALRAVRVLMSGEC